MELIGVDGPDVTLDQEVGRREELGEFYTGFQFLEDMGGATLGNCNGEKVLLIALAYRIGGKAWGVEDTIINNSTFCAVPWDRQEMEDNPFISHRIDPFVRHDDFKIIREPDRVIWQAGDRQYIARPPFWDIKGTHLGVDVDITMEQISSPDWYIGVWEDLPTHGRGGRDVWAKAWGTIKAGGKTYELEDNSFCTHEHVVTGERWTVTAIDSPIQYFMHTFRSDDMHIWLYARPDFSAPYARILFTDGTEVYYHGEAISIKMEDFWVDPQTQIRVPVKFRVDLNSPKGKVELTLKAYGRALYLYSLMMAERIHYDLFVHSDGRFISPDGKVTPIVDKYEDVSFAEWGFTNPMGSGSVVDRPERFR